MTYVFRAASKRTKRSIRIVAEGTRIPQSFIEEARRRVFGAQRAKTFEARFPRTQEAGGKR